MLNNTSHNYPTDIFLGKFVFGLKIIGFEKLFLFRFGIYITGDQCYHNDSKCSCFSFNQIRIIFKLNKITQYE